MMSIRRIFLKTLILSTICALTGLLTPGEAPGGRQVILATTEYPIYYGENLKNQGVISEIIRAAFYQAGYEVTITFLPWNRALEMTRHGDFNALFTAWYRKEREQWFAFSDPLPIANEIGFYKQKNRTISYRTIDDLRPYKIGTVRGYSNPPEFNQGKLNTEEVTDDSLNMHKLAVGRIDLVLIDKVIGQHIIDTELPESARDLEWLEPPLKIDNQYLMFSKKFKHYEKTIIDFNQALKQISDSGIVKAIMTRHGFY